MTKTDSRNFLRKKLKTTVMFLLVTSLMATWAVFAWTDSVYAAEGYEAVAGEGDMAKPKDIYQYGMTPISGDHVKDGTYTVDVESTSTYFRVDTAELTVKDGEMTAVLTMYSSSYSFMYMGSAEEAAAADFEEYIPLEEDDNYVATFTIPVESLNSVIECAAFSKKEKMWYPRGLLFDASELPEDAIDITLPDYDRISEAIDLYDDTYKVDTREELKSGEETETQVTYADETITSEEADQEGIAIDMADGTYSISVDMTGGSGRASIMTPTWLIIKDGHAYAKLLWSSTYYDYMIVDGVKYLNETTDGSNSTFTIPILEMNKPMEVIADTTAMGDPIEIEYKLTFYLDTIGPRGRVAQEGARTAVLIAAVIAVVGGVLNHFDKKRRARGLKVKEYLKSIFGRKSDD